MHPTSLANNTCTATSTLARHLKLLALMIIGLTLSSCAFGSKMTFSDSIVNTPEITGSVIVAASDLRPYVLSGERTPQWIGLQRSGIGIPYGVHTDSGKPLAEELVECLERSLQTKTRTFATPIRDNSDPLKDIRAALGKEGASKAILLNVREWKSDTYTDVSFHYDLELIIFDNAGKKLAEEKSAASTSLEGSIWNPVAASERSVRAKQREIFEDLLNRAPIKRALQS